MYSARQGIQAVSLRSLWWYKKIMSDYRDRSNFIVGGGGIAQNNGSWFMFQCVRQYMVMLSADDDMY